MVKLPKTKEEMAKFEKCRQRAKNSILRGDNWKSVPFHALDRIKERRKEQQGEIKQIGDGKNKKLDDFNSLFEGI